MLSLTLKARKGRKRSILLWSCVVAFAFLAGILSRFAVSQAGGLIMEAAFGIEEMWKVQMCMTVGELMIASDAMYHHFFDIEKSLRSYPRFAVTRRFWELSVIL